MFLGKVVLITGASSGIGAETALEFSSLGASLALVGRNKENLQNVASCCENVSPQKLKPLTIFAELTKDEDVEKIIKITMRHYEKLHVLVNNAGIYGCGTIETTSLDQYDTIMDTNVRATYYLTMLATPYLIKSKGNIVNISSVAGLRSLPNVLTYCMSKSALDQLTQCLSIELGPKGVRVNSVIPGIILTGIQVKGGMTEREYVTYVNNCKETHALGRPGDTKEVSSAILFLASDEASNITGVALPVDGGRQAMCPY